MKGKLRFSVPRPKGKKERRQDKLCPRCGKKTSYNSKHDAFFCLECNIWTEDGCNDKNCQFCSERPINPSQVGFSG